MGWIGAGAGAEVGDGFGFTGAPSGGGEFDVPVCS